MADPLIAAAVTVGFVLVCVACIGLGGIAVIVTQEHLNRRRPLQDVEPWISEGGPPRVTPDRRHRPRHDWRERCNT